MKKKFLLAKIIWLIIAHLSSTFLNLKTENYMKEQNASHQAKSVHYEHSCHQWEQVDWYRWSFSIGGCGLCSLYQDKNKYVRNSPLHLILLWLFLKIKCCSEWKVECLQGFTLIPGDIYAWNLGSFSWKTKSSFT